MINILNKIPKRITTKPSVSITNKGKRFAIIDYILYRIDNDNIKESDLMMVWYNTNKNTKVDFVKNIIVKDNKINKIKIIDDLTISCDCSTFKEKNDCRHISKMKKYFKM